MTIAGTHQAGVKPGRWPRFPCPGSQPGRVSRVQGVRFAAADGPAPYNDLLLERAMFGFGRLGRGGSLRTALMAGAGMMAWRWWKNRQATRDRYPSAEDAGLRRTYDTGDRGRTNPSGDSL